MSNDDKVGENVLTAGESDLLSQPGQGSLSPGTVVDGRYRIDKLINCGGMGAVYDAYHLLLERRVALKVLLPDLTGDEEARLRFKREAQSISLLNHPNIVQVFETGELPGNGPFLVMDFVEGKSLAAIIFEEKNITVSRAVRLLMQLLDAIAHAHESGIVHRDIKPSNILIGTDEGGEYLKIVDFGIAKIISGKEDQRLTATSVMLGSAPYMSPEQAGGGVVDARSDIYSIGCVMVEMLSGFPPFKGETSLDVMYRHMHEKFDGSQMKVPTAVASIINKCLEKKQEDRYQSASELKAALLHLPSKVIAEAKPKAVGRNKSIKVIALSGCIILLAAAVAAKFFLSQSQTRQLVEPRHANTHWESIRMQTDDLIRKREYLKALKLLEDWSNDNKKKLADDGKLHFQYLTSHAKLAKSLADLGMEHSGASIRPYLEIAEREFAEAFGKYEKLVTFRENVGVLSALSEIEPTNSRGLMQQAAAILKSHREEMLQSNNPEDCRMYCHIFTSAARLSVDQEHRRDKAKAHLLNAYECDRLHPGEFAESARLKADLLHLLMYDDFNLDKRRQVSNDLKEHLLSGRATHLSSEEEDKAYIYLADAFASLKQNKECEEVLEFSARRREPTSAPSREARRHLAGFFESQRDYRDAVRVRQSIIDSTSGKVDVRWTIEDFYDLANTYASAGNTDKAKETYKRMFALLQDSPAVQLAYVQRFVAGYLNFAKQNHYYDAGLKSCLAVADQTPREAIRASVLAGVGWWYEQSGDLLSAIKYYKQAVDKVPDKQFLETECIVSYARALYKSGRGSEAVALLDPLTIKATPRDFKDDKATVAAAEAWMLRGVIDYSKSKWEPALANFSHAYERFLRAPISRDDAHMASLLGYIAEIDLRQKNWMFARINAQWADELSIDKGFPRIVRARFFLCAGMACLGQVENTAQISPQGRTALLQDSENYLKFAIDLSSSKDPDLEQIQVQADAFDGIARIEKLRHNSASATRFFSTANKLRARLHNK